MKVKTNFNLLHDLVMILPTEKQQKTAAGIILTKAIDATAPVEGLVLTTGPGKRDKKDNLIPMQVKAGDKVIFMRNAAKEVKYSGDTLLVISISEVLCTVDQQVVE